MSATIRENACACLLAHAIWLARAECYELVGPHWNGLDPQAKNLYIQQALDILRANRPVCEDAPMRTAFVSVTRQPVKATGDKVIGHIDPTIPWGLSK